MSVSLIGLTLGELREYVEGLGEKRYRGDQLFHWIYRKKVAAFDEMTNISASFRTILKKNASLEALKEVTRTISLDGTVKFLFELADQCRIESVLIPPTQQAHDCENRLTLCVSTQVGCSVGCVFCATGSIGFTRNLTAGEIVAQLLSIQRIIPKRITNVVFMGMGEPMLNYSNVLKAVLLINDDRGINIGARHITISTVGYVDQIRQLADEGIPIKLALSLHTLDEEKRKLLIPIAKKYAVADLIDALMYYYQKTRQRPTLEYILFRDFNDTEEDRRRLIELGRKLPCKVNLIPYHSIDFVHPRGSTMELTPVPHEGIERFAQYLRDGNLTVTIRSSSGSDIRAACGQLAVFQQRYEELYV
ncbi:MAG: 23S rRNA (adenine(2503)-C(2))-methyltransferase RlmN [Bacteroidetes bacterium]|nr:23S rRNA (adenine(2503)-C(2))-methyltransferase RlmN [Bacteroidota bacterium]